MVEVILALGFTYWTINMSIVSTSAKRESLLLVLRLPSCITQLAHDGCTESDALQAFHVHVTVLWFNPAPCGVSLIREELLT